MFLLLTDIYQVPTGHQALSYLEMKGTNEIVAVGYYGEWVFWNIRIFLCNQYFQLIYSYVLNLGTSIPPFLILHLKGML